MVCQSTLCRLTHHREQAQLLQEVGAFPGGIKKGPHPAKETAPETQNLPVLLNNCEPMIGEIGYLIKEYLITLLGLNRIYP
jgi:hypothetical protein